MISKSVYIHRQKKAEGMQKITARSQEMMVKYGESSPNDRISGWWSLIIYAEGDVFFMMNFL